MKNQPSYINSSEQKDKYCGSSKQTPQFLDEEDLEINEDLKVNYSAPFRQKSQNGFNSKKENSKERVHPFSPYTPQVHFTDQKDLNNHSPEISFDQDHFRTYNNSMRKTKPSTNTKR